MSPVAFHTLTSPKLSSSKNVPTSFQFNHVCPSVAMSPFMKEERLLFLVTPLQLWEKYDHHHQQFNSFHHSSAYESNSLSPSPLSILEDEEYGGIQEYESAQEPPKTLTNSQRVKRTKPNGHISSRVEIIDSDTSSESSSSESEIEDERLGEDTPFLSIQYPMATNQEPATSYRLAESSNSLHTRRIATRLSSVIANQDPIAV